MGFLADHRNDSLEARELAALDILITPPVFPVDVVFGPFKGTFYAAANYLEITDPDETAGRVMLPMSARGAQRAMERLLHVDGLPWVLPTKKMVDLIYAQAHNHGPFIATTPDDAMTTLARFYAHDSLVRAKLDVDAPGWSNFLTAGHKKDVVLSNKLTPGKVAIYGWQGIAPEGTAFERGHGIAVQDLNASSHDDRYVDYSHGARPIYPTMLVNGVEMRVADVMRSAEMSALLSDEGPLRDTAYRTGPPTTPTMPAVDPTHLRTYEFVRARNFTSVPPGNARPLDLVVIHTMEMPEKGTTAMDCAHYFANQPEDSKGGTSAHFCIDAGQVVQCVEISDVAWAAPGANRNGIQLEHAGYARQSAEEWADAYSVAMLERSADLTAWLCTRFGIPGYFVDADALARGGARGITTHAEVSKAFKKSNHTDPGPFFPMDAYLAQVRAKMG